MPSAPSPDADVIIVGAGVAGLTSALRAKELGMEAIVLEKSDQVGGRASTRTVEDCRVDLGFQVLLPAYPELRRFVDIRSLNLGYFSRGCHVWDGGDWRSMVSPIDEFRTLLRSLNNKTLHLTDLVKLAGEIISCRADDLDDFFASESRSTADYLCERAYSPTAIEHFFRPFLGGVFLDDALETSAAMLRFVLHMFFRGGAALPAGGISAVGESLASQLPTDSVRTHSSVVEIDPERGQVSLEGGDRLHARHIVIATDAVDARSLVNELPEAVPFNPSSAWSFRVHSSKLPKALNKTLRLVSDQRNPIRVIACPSRVAPNYAPGGMETVTVTAKHGAAELTEAQIRAALAEVFGQICESWTCIAQFRIPRSLPRQLPRDVQNLPGLLRPQHSLVLCGDALHTRSLNGAMHSGRIAAEAIAESQT